MKQLSISLFVKNLARLILACFILFAGIGHLSFFRQEFQAEVPTWLPFDKDWVVLVSGWMELFIGFGMLFLPKLRPYFGIGLAIFLILVFPGNINQYYYDINAFGLDTESKRLIRLLFQPILIYWALWSMDSFNLIKKIKSK
ncbi:MAG: hypothetical protein K1X82_01165 [Bacteroidia bacterium]|nr:hypothetical protein [Bacteroidia bacterium]